MYFGADDEEIQDAEGDTDEEHPAQIGDSNSESDIPISDGVDVIGGQASKGFMA